MPSSAVPRPPASPTLTELPEPERLLLAGFGRYRSALAGGNPSAIVSAEAAFLELAHVVCDMARTPAAASRGATGGQTGESSMVDETKQEDETKGPSDQADGASGAGEQEGAADQPAAGDETSREASAQSESTFRTT